MFFFIGGIQPKTITLDDTPAICSACGLAQARLRRVDHYLSLFFIPLFPVKRGRPLLICDRCGAFSSAEQPGSVISRREQTIPAVNAERGSTLHFVIAPYAEAGYKESKIF